MGRRKLLSLFIFTSILLIFSLFIQLSFGTFKLNIFETLKDILNERYNTSVNILLNIRFPRFVISFLAGAVLAIGGNSFQLIVRNPLADPYIIGISSGASLGALIYTALIKIYSFHIPFTIEIFSFSFSLLSFFIVLILASGNNKNPVVSLILSGVLISLFFNSLVTLLSIMFWRNLIHVHIYLLGSFGAVIWKDLIPIILGFLIQTIVVLILAKKIEVLSFGDEMAIYSGINPQITRFVVITANVLSVSIVVSKVGIIGFVGLVIPHLVRAFVGPYIRISTIVNIIFGGIFLSWCDFFARTIFAPAEIPVGIITSIVGIPFFIYVLKKRGFQ